MNAPAPVNPVTRKWKKLGTLFLGAAVVLSAVSRMLFLGVPDHLPPGGGMGVRLFASMMSGLAAVALLAAGLLLWVAALAFDNVYRRRLAAQERARAAGAPPPAPDWTVNLPGRLQAVRGAALGEKALGVGTWVFLTIWFFVLLHLFTGRQAIGGVFGAVALVLMTLLPVAHAWGYFGRNRVFAGIAALLLNLFASYVSGLLWYGGIFMDHGMLGVAVAGTLFMSPFLVLGYLMVCYRVCLGRAERYAYLGVAVLTVAATMLEAWWVG